MKKFNWEGICHKGRTEGISLIEQNINRHGFILNFKMFSDLAISIMAEVPENKINVLFEDLSEVMTLFNFKSIDSQSDREATIFLNVTFSKGTGNMRIEVPDIGD